MQEDLKNQKLFHARLEDTEKQIQDIQNKIKTSVNDTDSAKVAHDPCYFP